ncbi:MAG: acylneuraminate cytidylyltransferase [Geobacter sp.]|nr:acylneuraminate cytidylyltransferase [Geobacter sp.]
MSGGSNTNGLLAIIPARGGSKGIPGKNIRMVAGLPLIAHSIRAALEAKSVSKTIVSTDDLEIADVSRSFGAEVIMRPEELALDATPTEPVLRHVLETIAQEPGFVPEHVVLLQPTSPLRTADDIDAAYELFLSEGRDSLLSVCPYHGFIWSEGGKTARPLNYDYRNRPRRQDMSQFLENGSIYIFGRDRFIAENNRLCGTISLYVMPEERSPEIDTLFDLELVEQLFRARKKDNPAGLEARIGKIRMLVTDVDGVLTDGGMYYGPQGEALKLFNTRDGMGLELVRKAGIQVAIITKENSEIVRSRARKLKIEEVHVGIEDKFSELVKLLERHGLKPEQVCYVGDDVNDLEVMRGVGLPVAVADAVTPVRDVAAYVTRACGGKGAVREVCDLLIATR